MTTWDRNGHDAGRCGTVGAGPLLTSEELYAEAVMCSDERREFSDEAAATVASWWHGPSGDGAVFSRLSHRIAGGVTVPELHDVIYRAQRTLDKNEDRRPKSEVNKDRMALDMLATWAMNGPGA